MLDGATPRPNTTLGCLLSAAKLFAPAILTWVLWSYVLTVNNAWAAAFSSSWYMSIAMGPASMIAGSTPCSAGVVIYPVTQLLPLQPPPDSRDASILLQAVGLAAATYTILLRKQELLHGCADLLLIFNVVGVIGVCAGLIAAIERTAANVLFTGTVFAFGVAYFYSSEVMIWFAPPHTVLGRTEQAHEEGAEERLDDPASVFLASAAAFCGGFLTATIGTGADIMLYAFGVFGWKRSSRANSLGPAQLTAAAVVTMTLQSTLTCLGRALSVDGGFTRPTLLCWAVMVPVVVVGAPLGALCLSPSRAVLLRRLFFVLAAGQFIGYVTFNTDFINSLAWRIVGGALILEMVAIMLHFHGVRIQYSQYVSH